MVTFQGAQGQVQAGADGGTVVILFGGVVIFVLFCCWVWRITGQGCIRVAHAEQDVEQDSKRNMRRVQNTRTV